MVRRSQQALRAWARSHPYLAAIIACVVISVAATAAWLALSGRDPGTAIFGGLSNVVVYWLIILVYLRAMRKQSKELAGKGQIGAFIRYPDSLPGSLSGIWNPGVVTPATDKGRVELAASPESLDMLAAIRQPIGHDGPGPGRG